MSIGRIAAVLRETSGLEVDALGVHHLTEAVKRLAVLSDLDLPAYADLVIADADARGLLIGELLVHETSFFRYPASFEHLAAHARARAAARPGPVRILSAACATGQEAYSVAITLLEAGLPPERIAVDAFDRSAAAVEIARAGRYERGGTRGLDPERAERWCSADTGTLTVVPAVRALVRFACGSLLGADRPFAHEAYDAVLCRNLLIYLTESARRRALTLLGDWLTPGGLLYLGHAEVLVARAEGFVPLADPGTYVCAPAPANDPRPRPFPTPTPATPASGSSSAPARPGAATRPSSPTPPTSPGRPPSTRAPADAVPSTPPPAPVALAAPAAPAAPTALSREAGVLRTARDLADAGRLDEACAVLDDEVVRGRPSADAYHLLAVVRRASGQAREADAALARALYLDPTHAGALLLAAVSAEGRGERTTAARLHARARAAVQGKE